jgi:hypothetical protein
MGRLKSWKGGYSIQRGPQLVDNIGGYHFIRTCWNCRQVDKCRCPPERVNYYKSTWYMCLACKIQRGEVTEGGHPLW